MPCKGHLFFCAIKTIAMKTKFFLLFIMSGLFSFFTNAQDNQDSAGSLSRPYFKASIEYLNNNVYLGRKDSVAIPYITPEISYHFKSGVYLNGSVSYLPTESRVDVSTIGAGYALVKEKWDAEFSAEKYFYNSQSYNVKAETKGDVSASIGYDLGFVESDFSGTVSFAAKNDYAASFGLDHELSLLDDDLSITPSFVVNASTQNSYASYYQKRRYSKTKKGKKAGFTATANSLNASQFKILDYEFSIPFDYGVKGFTFSFTPTVAIPVNANTILFTLQPANGPAVTRTFTENIGATFFWSLGVSYRIKRG